MNIHKFLEKPFNRGLLAWPAFILMVVYDTMVLCFGFRFDFAIGAIVLVTYVLAFGLLFWSDGVRNRKIVQAK